jgi:hypothetical protein
VVVFKTFFSVDFKSQVGYNHNMNNGDRQMLDANSLYEQIHEMLMLFMSDLSDEKVLEVLREVTQDVEAYIKEKKEMEEETED